MNMCMCIRRNWNQFIYPNQFIGPKNELHFKCNPRVLRLMNKSPLKLSTDSFVARAKGNSQTIPPVLRFYARRVEIIDIKDPMTYDVLGLDLPYLTHIRLHLT